MEANIHLNPNSHIHNYNKWAWLQTVRWKMKSIIKASIMNSQKNKKMWEKVGKAGNRFKRERNKIGWENA